MKTAAVLCVILAMPILAQDESSLRRAFEGRTVRVKIDMPAASAGIDINWRRDPPMDMRMYSQRIKTFGVAIHAGDSVMVTTVRVKGKNIEFQLAGGGYGTAHDDKGDVPMPTVPKSNREMDLEKAISREQDRDRRDHMKSELARMQDQRRREESRLQEDAKREEYERKREIEFKRLGAGSRFNIWFPDDRLKESVPTPQELAQILGPWVDFDNSGGPPPPPQAPPPMPTAASVNAPPRDYPSGSAPMRLARGISIEQVHAILGMPAASRPSRQGDLNTLTENWESNDDRTEVFFVNGTVIKYSIVSK